MASRRLFLCSLGLFFGQQLPVFGWRRRCRCVRFTGTLRQAAEPRGLLVGAAAFPEGLEDEWYAHTLASQFNLLAPENAMKWEPIHPQPERWNFAPADRLVDFATRHRMQVFGHVLVWHQQLPGYVQDLAAYDLRRAMREHIRTLVGHYKGRVRGWDVVNEAVDDACGLRRTIFLDKLGEDYIARAFWTAHEADPDALLFYNDYGCDGLGPKSDRQFALLSTLRSQGVPVHGVGLQMHISARLKPRPEDVAANVRRLTDLGLRVHISEMDVRIRDLPGCWPHRLQVQAQTYGQILAACLREPGFDGIKFWGFTDRHSWIHQHFGADGPLLFDFDYRPKPAYLAVRDALAHVRAPDV
jgi:endo-1,4-beta-xylanase